MRAAAALLVAALALHGQHGLRFTTPATAWDEALPPGNGMPGALVWGDGQPLKIPLDRADLWDLRPVPEFSSDEYRFDLMKRWREEGRVKDLIRVYEAPYHRPAPTRIPAGRIEIMLDGARFAEASLRVENAIGSVGFAGGGKKAERALEIFSTAFTLRNSFHANGDQSGRGYSKFTYRPFALDGDFAMAAGLQAMLIQSHGGRVRLFPAAPETWAAASFAGLRAEGGLIADARLKGGRLAEATPRAQRGGQFLLGAPGLNERTLEPAAGETRGLP
jgi:hypothetical protein